MSWTRTPSGPSASTRTRRRSSGIWARLCAETLAGIADPLFPALTVAEVVPPAAAARAALAGLLEPLETPLRSQVFPAWLLPHQVDAVARAQAILDRFGGVLIADGVGLGKTYLALALAALERSAGGDAVAIVPAALRDEWERAARECGVQVGLLTHTALARRAPSLPSHCSLLLVDEAHAFRNPRTRRYDRLARLAVGRRVALLSATPINNTARDLVALVQLFTGRDRFREFGVSDLGAALTEADHGGAPLALAALSVCRTRRLVEARFPQLRGAFPRRALMAAVRYDLDQVYGGRLTEILEALEALRGANAEEERGAALLQLTLLRRLESSRVAFRRSLLRHRAFLAECERAAESGVRLSRRDFRAAFPRSDEDDTQLVLWPVLRQGANASHRRDYSEWRHAVERALAAVVAASGSQDAKCAALETLLEDSLAGRRTIVFTEYRDTAFDLLRRLRRRFRALAVTGDSGWAGTTRLGRREALDAFAPVARRARADPLLDADLLIATDVAGEGMNLQDAAAVVNYDLPWNPVRVMQRVGRVDRLHSPHREVAVAHLLPARGLHRLTGVLRTLRAKLGETAAPGAEPDPLGALWWVDQGRPDPDALERESWRRVEPFEARERWRAILGNASGEPRGSPCIAAGILADDGPPAAGILLALEWSNGRRIPLPFVLTGNGRISYDATQLGLLAERMLHAEALPAAPPDFSDPLATALPRARALLAEFSAARRGTVAAGSGRRLAVDTLRRLAFEARRRRDRGTLELAERALDLLGCELAVGLDRLLLDLLHGVGRGPELAAKAVDLLSRANTPARPALDGTPRLVLLAAFLLATRCPADA